MRSRQEPCTSCRFLAPAEAVWRGSADARPQELGASRRWLLSEAARRDRRAGGPVSLLYFVIKTKASEVAQPSGAAALQQRETSGKPSSRAAPRGSRVSPPLSALRAPSLSRGGSPPAFPDLLPGLVALPRGLSRPTEAAPVPCHSRATEPSFSTPGLGLSRRQDRAAGPPPGVARGSWAQHPCCGSFLAAGGVGGGPCPPSPLLRPPRAPRGHPRAALGWCITEAFAGGGVRRRAAGTR